MKELSGKTVIITGASAGIGAATAQEMTALDVNLVLAARSENKIQKIADEINASGGNALAAPCDVSDYSQVQNCVDAAKSKFGSIDIIVNNAGVIEPIARMADSDPTAWGQAIDINVKGVYHMTRAALPTMEAQGAGVIINISSGAAYGAMEGWSHYCTSKAAALMITKATHKEYAEKGIRSVGLSPGTVATQMQIDIKASGINPVSQLDPSVHIPPEWPAKCICWLATDDAREFDGDDVSLREDEIKRRCGLI